jgi:hypothetical protein
MAALVYWRVEISKSRSLQAGDTFLVAKEDYIAFSIFSRLRAVVTMVSLCHNQQLPVFAEDERLHKRHENAGMIHLRPCKYW